MAVSGVLLSAQAVSWLHLELPIGAVRFVAGDDVNDRQLPSVKKSNEAVDVVNNLFEILPALRLMEEELLHVDNGESRACVPRQGRRLLMGFGSKTSGRKPQQQIVQGVGQDYQLGGVDELGAIP